MASSTPQYMKPLPRPREGTPLLNPEGPGHSKLQGYLRETCRVSSGKEPPRHLGDLPTNQKGKERPREGHVTQGHTAGRPQAF